MMATKFNFMLEVCNVVQTTHKHQSKTNIYPLPALVVALLSGRGMIECHVLSCVEQQKPILILSVRGAAGNKQTLVKTRTPPIPRACRFRCGLSGAASQWQGKDEQNPCLLPEMNIAFFRKALFTLPFLIAC